MHKFTVEEAIAIAKKACAKAHHDLSLEDLNNTQSFNDNIAIYLGAAFKEGAPTIAGRTITEWREFAKRDDCLDRMTPSDLRAILNAVQ